MDTTTSEVFYAVRGKHSGLYYDGACLPQATPTGRARLETVAAAVDRHRAYTPGVVTQIVRIVRTTVPGLKTPASTKRELVQPGEFKSQSKFAILNGSHGYLKATCKHHSHLLINTFSSAFSPNIDDALLFDEEDEALHDAMQQALNQGYAWSTHHLVRIREVETPATSAPDVVTDVVTVL